jgi:hypothetical protein
MGPEILVPSLARTITRQPSGLDFGYMISQEVSRSVLHLGSTSSEANSTTMGKSKRNNYFLRLSIYRQDGRLTNGIRNLALHLTIPSPILAYMQLALFLPNPMMGAGHNMSQSSQIRIMYYRGG